MLDKASKFHLVFLIIRSGGNVHHVKFSTIEVAKEIGVSQQSASRWLSELEEEKMIERGKKGVKLTRYGMARCKTIYQLLRGVFEERKNILVEGAVTRGVGDGKVYMAMPEYKSQIKSKLGFAPFPGTLNLLVSEREIKTDLIAAKGIVLDGFIRNGREMGNVKCFPCKINEKLDGAVVIPSRSHYETDVLELISPDNLRRKLKLKDGSLVNVEIKI